MSREIRVVEKDGYLERLEKIADYVVKSRLFGVSTKEQAISLMLLAEAEGIHPMRAVQEYHIIQGRPCLRADAMLARFLQAGGRVIWHELNDEKARATFEHPQGGKVTIEWDIQRAKKAGLLDKAGSNWLKYPRQMLRARVISEGVRTVYPNVTVGIYTPEEVQDFGVNNTTDIEVVTVDVETGEIKTKDEPQAISHEPRENLWNLEKIKEVASEELKHLVREKKIRTKELIELFTKHNGNQEKIIEEIKNKEEVSHGISNGTKPKNGKGSLFEAKNG